jgi:hypothetical protein
MAKFIFLGLFIVLMIAVGIYSRKKVTDMDDCPANSLYYRY